MFITYAVLMIVGAIALVIDLAAGAGLISGVVSALQLAGRGTETDGTITWVDDRKPGWAARVRVAYETPGGTLSLQTTSQRPWIGSIVPVRYNPMRPAQATTLIRPWRRALVGIPTVLLIAVAAGGLIISGAWYFSGTHTPLQIPLVGGSATLGIALMCGSFAARRYPILLNWRRLSQTDGTVRRYADHSPVGPGILISFPTADGNEEFWVRAGTIPAKVGDTVTVRYSPDRPATTATVQNAEDVRASAIASTVVAAGCAAFALYLYSML